MLSVSVDRKQTLAGKLFSNSNENKNYTLRYVKYIHGYINDSIEFQMKDFLSNREVKLSAISDTTWVMVKPDGDSLTSEPAFAAIGRKEKLGYIEWMAGMQIRNKAGEVLGAFQFGGNNIENPCYVWIRKDLPKATTYAIVSVFALLIAAVGI